jgi:hypothetical protein
MFDCFKQQQQHQYYYYYHTEDFWYINNHIDCNWFKLFIKEKKKRRYKNRFLIFIKKKNKKKTHFLLLISVILFRASFSVVLVSRSKENNQEYFKSFIMSGDFSSKISFNIRERGGPRVKII